MIDKNKQIQDYILYLMVPLYISTGIRQIIRIQMNQIIKYFKTGMNFNKFQKYRAEKAALEQTSKANHHINFKEELPAQKIQPTTVLAQQQANRFNLNALTTQSESYINSKGIKLRDYMYITSKSSKKQHSSRKQVPAQTKLRTSSSNSSVNLNGFRPTTTRAKYEASNQEIFELAKNDINSELDQVVAKAKQIKTKFEHIFQCEKVDNSSMVELYNIRKNLKEKVLKQLQTIEGFIDKNSTHCKSESISDMSLQSNHQRDRQTKISKSIYLNESQLKLGKQLSAYSFKI